MAIQRIFFRRPLISNNILKMEPNVAQIFVGDRSRFRHIFGKDEALRKKFEKFEDWASIEAEYEKLNKLGVSLLTISDSNYPNLLKEIFDPPTLLYHCGNNTQLFERPCVAIVGSRKASEHGIRIAVEIAESLSSANIVVVSGLALGIDSAAHRGALFGGTGTAAIAACGLDYIYPTSNIDLAQKIKETGLIVSEFPLGELAQRPNFPQRNRIISGLCIATIVVEAAERSGSLITARFALEQNREVMAVPGSAGSIPFRGTNKLIRDGAHLVESGEDVIQILPRHISLNSFSEITGHEPKDVGNDSPLLKILRKHQILSVDQLIEMASLPASEVLAGLTGFVLEGIVEELAGRKFRLKGE